MLEWFDIKDNPMPVGKPVLVYFKKPILNMRVHTAYKDRKSRITFVAGRFDFDCPKITHWAYVPNLPK
jgi:hypothetical protein